MTSNRGSVPYLADPDVTLYHGDALEVLRELPDESVNCCVTSPPYLDRRSEYESPSLPAFEDIFRELARVVTGPLLLNVGRVFRDRCEVRWQEHLLERIEWAGWSHLDTRIWIKPNGNPLHGEVFADRHEYVFVLGEPGMELNVDAVRVPYAASSVPRMRRGWINHTGVKNDDKRRSGRRSSEPHPLGGRPPSYMVIDTGREKGIKHPCPMALDLALELVQLGSWPGDTIIDPFAGSGTTGLAARRLGRRAVLIDAHEPYCAEAAQRLSQQSLLAEAL